MKILIKMTSKLKLQVKKKNNCEDIVSAFNYQLMVLVN